MTLAWLSGALAPEQGAWDVGTLAGQRWPAALGILAATLVTLTGTPLRAEDDPLAAAAALADAPPVFATETPAEPPAAVAETTVNLLVAVHKTATERYSDTHQKRRRPRSLARLAAGRAADDRNFTNRTKFLARRIEEARRAETPQLGVATTGEEFLNTLIEASRRAPIANLVVYGHAASTSLFGREDRGFYASVPDVARETKIMGGNDEEKLELLRATGARDLSDLERLVRDGEIRFAKNPVIVFAGCGVAGKKEVEPQGIAGRAAEIANATVIASIDVTDQSMGRGAKFRNHEYSRKTWVRFMPQQTAERLNTRVIDALKFLNLSGPVVAENATRPAPN